MSVPHSSDNRRTIHASCAVHRGPVGFANLVVTKLDGTIELDPHVDRGCVILLDEGGARALSDALVLMSSSSGSADRRIETTCATGYLMPTTMESGPSRCST